MPQASGSLTGKTNSAAMVSLNDVSDHEMSIVEVTGQQSSSDPLWNGTTVVYWGLPT